MLNRDVLYVLQNGPTPEELGVLACSGKSAVVVLTPLERSDDGAFVPYPRNYRLELSGFSLERDGRDETFPVEIRARVAHDYGAVILNGLQLEGSTVYILYNPDQQVGVVQSFSRYQSVQYRVPSDCPRDEKAEHERQDLLRTLGLDLNPRTAED